MDPITLAQEIIDGRRITRDDDLSFFLTCDLDELCKGADMIREKFIGDKVDLCSIINGRSGKCPEDCKYCAQSAHNHTNCEVYNFLPEEKILEACRMNEREGVDRFSIVTAGKALTGRADDMLVHGRAAGMDAGRNQKGAAKTQFALAALDRRFDQGRLKQVIIGIAETRDPLVFKTTIRIDARFGHIT